MGNQSEPQWLLQRLAMKLESEMRRMSSSDEKVRKAKPPISMAELRKRKGSGKVSEETQTRTLQEDVEATAVSQRAVKSG